MLLFLLACPFLAVWMLIAMYAGIVAWIITGRNALDYLDLWVDRPLGKIDRWFG